MNKLLALLIMAISIFSTSIPVQADMSYATFSFNCLDENGNAITDGTYAVVLDLDGDGFNGIPYTSQSVGTPTANSYLWDNDDLLMDVGPIVNGEAFPFRKIKTAEIPANFNPNVDHMYVLWFNKPFAGLGGDFNGDGKVNLTDFGILKNNFGKSGVGPEEGDVNGDGIVNLTDFGILKNNFGATAAPGAGVRYGAAQAGAAGADPGNYVSVPAGGNSNLQTV